MIDTVRLSTMRYNSNNKDRVWIQNCHGCDKNISAHETSLAWLYKHNKKNSSDLTHLYLDYSIQICLSISLLFNLKVK